MYLYLTTLKGYYTNISIIVITCTSILEVSITLVIVTNLVTSNRFLDLFIYKLVYIYLNN